MSRARYVIEGTWSGYHSGQQRVVHREVTRDAARVEWARTAGGIVYTDGTWLYIDVREARPRERVVEISGYGSLISDCVAAGVNSVSALMAVRRGAR